MSTVGTKGAYIKYVGGGGAERFTNFSKKIC